MPARKPGNPERRFTFRRRCDVIAEPATPITLLSSPKTMMSTTSHTPRRTSKPGIRPGSGTRIPSCSASLISSVPEFTIRRRPPDDAHEMIEGLMQPIPRPSKAHDAICKKLEAALREHLACSLEQVFTARDRRPLCTDRSTLYPDFWVSTLCRDPVNEQRVAYPGLVVEVLSPFREKVDRGAKLHAYREIDSVHELLVIDPARGRSELYRRCGPRQWHFTDVDRSEPIHLDSIGLSLEGLPG